MREEEEEERGRNYRGARFEGRVRLLHARVAFRGHVREADDRGLRASNGLSSEIPG